MDTTSDDGDRPNEVHEVHVSIDGTEYAGSYYIEDGIIIAVVGGKTYRLPVGSVPAAETVKALVLELQIGFQR